MTSRRSLSLLIAFPVLILSDQSHAQVDLSKCNQVLNQIEVPLNATLGDWAPRTSVNSTAELNVFRQAYEYFANNGEGFAIDAENASMNKSLADSGGLQLHSRAYSEATKRSKAAAAKVLEDWKDPEKREAMIQKRIRDVEFSGADQDAEGSLNIGRLLQFKPDGKIDEAHFRKGEKDHPTISSGNYSLYMPMSAKLIAKDREKKMTYDLKTTQVSEDGKFKVLLERNMKGVWGPDLIVELQVKKDKCVIQKIQSEMRSEFRSLNDNNSTIGIRRTFFSQENCGKAQAVLGSKEFHKQPANLVLSQSHMEVYYCHGGNHPIVHCKNANETSPYANITPDPKPAQEKYYAKFCKPFESSIEKVEVASSKSWFRTLTDSITGR